jgi:hypothetical protein
LNFLTLMMGPIVCPLTWVRNYQSLRNYPAECSSQITGSSESRCALGCSVPWSPTHA